MPLVALQEGAVNVEYRQAPTLVVRMTHHRRALQLLTDRLPPTLLAPATAVLLLVLR